MSEPDGPADAGRHVFRQHFRAFFAGSIFSITRLASGVASGYLEAVFFGGGRYDLYVRANVWATILGFISTLAIIAVWRLPGAFWSVFVSSALLLGSYLFYVRHVRPLDQLFRPGFDW